MALDMIQLLQQQMNQTGKVSGNGNGVSDSVKLPLADKRGNTVGRAALSEGEYVLRADTVSKLGGGATDPGAKFLDELVKILDKMDTESATTFAQTVLMLGSSLVLEQPSTSEIPE